MPVCRRCSPIAWRSGSKTLPAVSRPSPQPDASSALRTAKTALVIKPSSLGDVIHTLPAVDSLHRHRPDLAIDWLVNTEWAPLLEGNPGLREVIPLPRRQWRGWRDWPRARRWAAETLGDLRPDLVLDFQGLLRSALLAKASHGAHRVGFARAREGAALFYDRRVPVADWRGTHAVDRYLALVRALGVPGEDRAAARFPLPAGEAVPLPGGGRDGPFLLLHPFSRGRGKSMLAPEIVALCKRLDGYPVVLVGSGAAWPPGLARPATLVDLMGQTSLPQLIWLMRRARWIASVDSGPMHLAAAVTDRLLSIHTWTDPLMVGPWRREAWVWRDGFLGRVGEIAPGRFPEDRRGRSRFERGILDGESTARLGAFLNDRMAESPPEDAG